LALKHLLSRKRHTFLIFLGIALGSMTYVFISGVQLGFREFIVAQLVNNDAHVKVQGREEEITPKSMREALYTVAGDGEVLIDWLVLPSGKRNSDQIINPYGWISRFTQDPTVQGFSPQLITQAIATRGSVRLAASLVGVIPERHLQTTDLARYTIEGDWRDVARGGRHLMAGDGFMNKIGAQTGDTVWLSVGNQSAQPFQIAGRFKLGVQQVDDTTLYGSLNDVQQLNQTPGHISTIALRLYDVTQARDFAARYRSTSDDRIQSWDEINANFLSLFKIQDLTRYLITGGIFCIAAFGIYNVLSIVVNQKRREIAILRALGFTPQDILKLFLQQGIILGTLGGVFGLFLGYGLCVFLANLDIDVMGRKGLTVSFNPSIYYIGFAMAMISSLLAGYLPARAASKLAPIEIIRMDS